MNGILKSDAMTTKQMQELADWLNECPFNLDLNVEIVHLTRVDFPTKAASHTVAILEKKPE